MATALQEMKRQGDFVELNGSDEYARYFNHLTRIFRFLVEWYKNLIDGGATEERLATGFLARMLFTVDLLRLKQFYDPNQRCHLDLNDSGFPHAMTIMELEADLRGKSGRLPKLSPRNTLIELMLNEMFDKRKEPTELLQQMAETEYNTLIDEGRLMLPFTPGELELKATRPTYRKYLYSWACYDFASNTPFIHLLAFDQDISDEPLEEHGPAYDHFMQVVKAEGSRAPTVGVLAHAIDEALGPIHPKVLKRVRIGPILSPRFSRYSSPDPLLDILRQKGDPDDFAVKLTSEVIISQRQVERPRKLLSLSRAKRVREIFAIPEPTGDLRCYNQQASKVYDHILLPHHVLQQVADDPAFAPYAAAGKIVYTREGELYVL